MRAIIYTCDKCRQPKLENEVAEVNVSLNIPNGFTVHSYSRSVKTSTGKHICKQCLQDMKLFTELKEGEKIIPQKESDIKDRLYDVINDILVDLGVHFEE